MKKEKQYVEGGEKEEKNDERERRRKKNKIQRWGIRVKDSKEE